MARRRTILLIGAAGLAAVSIAAVLLYRSSRPTTTDCGTVSALIEYNRQFNDQIKQSDPRNSSSLTTENQYRDWADRFDGDADKIADPQLSDKVKTAGEWAHRITDLVPRYRAKPDDPRVAREYLDAGIKFGNAISRLQYSCVNQR